MRALVRNPKDFWAGVLFLAFGVSFVVVGRGYPMGTARAMGPAFFPVVLGALLAVVGAATLVRGAIRPGEKVGGLALKQMAFVLGSVVLYGVLLRNVGLVVSVLALVLVGGLASARFRWTRFLLLGAGLAAFSSLVFIKALGLPIPLWGRW